MAKYYGAIGFGVMEETAPDVFREIVTEKYTLDKIVHTPTDLDKFKNLEARYE